MVSVRVVPVVMPESWKAKFLELSALSYRRKLASLNTSGRMPA
jgi:hypothetical protein